MTWRICRRPEDNSSLRNRSSARAGPVPEWNLWLNGAPYSAPQWATIYTNEARVIVDTLFGGLDDTPIMGDADPVHGARGNSLGKNALYFDGRVQKARSP